MRDDLLKELLNVVERRTRRASKSRTPKISGTKKAKEKKAPQSEPSSSPALEITNEPRTTAEDSTLTSATGKKGVRRGPSKRAKGKKQKLGAARAPKEPTITPEQEILIRKINEIYALNGYERTSPLHIYDVATLRNHLNLLQWGLIPWMTPLGKLPDPPDEIPPEGFKCVKGATPKWTNAHYCQLRVRKPELYWECKDCQDYIKMESS